MWFFLLACHVFQDASVTCVQGQPCASEDSAVIPSGSLGWLLSVEEDSTASGVVFRYHPGGEEAEHWDSLGAATGALAWDSARGLVILGESGLVWVQDAGTLQTGLLASPGDTSPVWFSDDLVLASGDHLSLPSDDLSSIEEQAGFVDLSLLLVSGSALYALDDPNGSPILYSLNRHYTGEALFKGALPTGFSPVSLLMGPDDSPWLCGKDGSLWSLSNLEAGSPSLAPDLKSVTDCAFDQELQQFLLFSSKSGLFLLDQDGTLTLAQKPLQGYTMFRASFYTGNP